MDLRFIAVLFLLKYGRPCGVWVEWAGGRGGGGSKVAGRVEKKITKKHEKNSKKITKSHYIV